jgi:hypothetical protein
MIMPRATDGPERSSVDSWFSSTRFALLLGLLLVVQYPGLVTGSHSLFLRDFGHFWYPNAGYTRASFWSGEIPLWNPLSSCGIPFLAQWNTMVLYPPALLYVLLPLPWSLNLFCVLHLFLGGLGMFCLTRRLTGSGLGAALAGLAFACNGVTMTVIMLPSIAGALGLAPWVMNSLIEAWRKGGCWLVWAAVLGTLQMLTGGVEVVVLTWLVLGLLALDEWIARTENRRKLVTRFLGVVMLVSFLSAIQLLPFLQLLSGSERSETSAGSISAMPLQGWANFLVPLFGTRQTSGGLPFQPGQFWLTSYYLGIGPFALALAAVLLRPNRRVWLLASAAVLFLVLAWGDRGLVHTWLVKACPLVGVMRFPVKFVLGILLVMPMLVAETGRVLSFGRTSPVRAGRTRLVGVFSSLAVVVVALVLAAPSFQTEPAWVRAAQLNGLTRLAFLVATGALVVALAASGSRRQTLVCGLALLGIGWLDVLTHAPQQAPTVASEILRMPLTQARTMSETPAPGSSRAMLSRHALVLLDRTQLADPAQSYLGLRLGLYCNCNLPEGIPKVDGFYSLFPKYHSRLMARLYTSPSVPEAVPDLLGASQITAPDSATDWQTRSSWLPMVTGGQQPVWGEDRSVLGRLFSPGFDPRREIVLAPDSRSQLAAVSPGQATIQMRHFSNHALGFSCEAERTTLVSISQSYDPGWRATVDGQPTRLWRANLAFQALVVPAGRHEVSLTYEDRWFRLGAGLTMLTTLAMLAFWKGQTA